MKANNEELVKECESDLAKANADADDAQFRIDELEKDIEFMNETGSMDGNEEDELVEAIVDLNDAREELRQANKLQTKLKHESESLQAVERMENKSSNQLALEKLQNRIERDRTKAEDLEKKIESEFLDQKLERLYEEIKNDVQGWHLYFG